MRTALKKLLEFLKPIDRVTDVTPDPTRQQKNNNDLIAKLNEVVEKEPILEELLTDPVNKLYILNTYTGSFGDLLTNLLNKNLSRQIKAVNTNAYFKDHEDNIGLTLTRVIRILESVPSVNPMIEHDLYEVIDVISYFERFAED